MHKYIELINSEEMILNLPTQILGREQLSGPKENYQVFKLSISKILNSFQNKNETIYIGDSMHELAFAKRLGLATLNIFDFNELEFS